MFENVDESTTRIQFLKTEIPTAETRPLTIVLTPFGDNGDPVNASYEDDYYDEIIFMWFTKNSKDYQLSISNLSSSVIFTCH